MFGRAGDPAAERGVLPRLAGVQAPRVAAQLRLAVVEVRGTRLVLAVLPALAQRPVEFGDLNRVRRCGLLEFGPAWEPRISGYQSVAP
jgi:hypothetical protein